MQQEIRENLECGLARVCMCVNGCLCGQHVLYVKDGFEKENRHTIVRRLAGTILIETEECITSFVERITGSVSTVLTTWCVPSRNI